MIIVVFISAIPTQSKLKLRFNLDFQLIHILSQKIYIFIRCKSDMGPVEDSHPVQTAFNLMVTL